MSPAGHRLAGTQTLSRGSGQERSQQSRQSLVTPGHRVQQATLYQLSTCQPTGGFCTGEFKNQSPTFRSVVFKDAAAQFKLQKVKCNRVLSAQQSISREAGLILSAAPPARHTGQPVGKGICLLTIYSQDWPHDAHCLSSRYRMKNTLSIM